MSEFETVAQLPVPDSGTLLFILRIPSSAAPGQYMVRITVAGEEPLLAAAGTQSTLTLEQPLTIVADDPPHTDPPPADMPIIDPSGTYTVYLPMVKR